MARVLCSPRGVAGGLSSAYPPRKYAFTLIELLVVIGIILILMAFTVPAANRVVRGSALTQGAQMLRDQLSLARQVALTKNNPVEVRLYKFADPDAPGEREEGGEFRALQTFEILASGTAIAQSKVQELPTSIIIDSGSTLSTLAGPTRDKQWVAPADPKDPKVKIPRVGTDYECRAFRFTSDGSTDLTPTDGWFLTLHNFTDGDDLSTPPANFVTLQVDPVNGDIREFRPH